METKRSIKISFRASREEVNNADLYAKVHSLTRSKVLQKVLDHIGAKTQLEQPKEYQEPSAPESNIRNTAKIINNLNVLINTVRLNYLQSKKAWANLGRLPRELSRQKINPNGVKKLINAFKEIGYQIRENTQTIQATYKCLSLIESEVK